METKDEELNNITVGYVTTTGGNDTLQQSNQSGYVVEKKIPEVNHFRLLGNESLTQAITLESIKNQLTSLEATMIVLKAQIALIEEGSKKYSRRKLGSK